VPPSHGLVRVLPLFAAGYGSVLRLLFIDIVVARRPESIERGLLLAASPMPSPPSQLLAPRAGR
jgi:hypothetical protein